MFFNFIKINKNVCLSILHEIVGAQNRIELNTISCKIAQNVHINCIATFLREINTRKSNTVLQSHTYVQ